MKPTWPRAWAHPPLTRLPHLSRPCPAPATPTLPPAAIIRGSIGGSRTLTRPWPLTQFMQNQARAARVNVTSLASLVYGSWAPFASGAAATNLK